MGEGVAVDESVDSPLVSRMLRQKDLLNQSGISNEWRGSGERGRGGSLTEQPNRSTQ